MRQLILCLALAAALLTGCQSTAPSVNGTIRTPDVIYSNPGDPLKCSWQFPPVGLFALSSPLRAVTEKGHQPRDGATSHIGPLTSPLE